MEKFLQNLLSANKSFHEWHASSPKLINATAIFFLIGIMFLVAPSVNTFGFGGKLEKTAKMIELNFEKSRVEGEKKEAEKELAETNKRLQEIEDALKNI